MQSRFFMSLVVAALVSTFVLAFAAGAQETTDESAGDNTTDTQAEDSGQSLVFAESEQTAQAEAQAAAEQPGPLAGTRVETISTDDDDKVEIMNIPRPDCTPQEGASFVLQDEDGTQADFIDGVNVEVTAVEEGLKVVSIDPAEDADIDALNVRGGKDEIPVLDTGGLVIVTSTGITCEASTPPPDNNPPPDNSPPPDGSPPPDNASPTPEPQDRDKGPLAGGTAVGKDVLVPGDVIDILPDDTKVVGIDQIIIKTKNCKLTAHGDDLTITMSDQGVPFRIRDGQNADITIRPDGTIVANGRRTLGDDFPEGQRDNPDRLIIPIPVDPENDTFPREPNDLFPIISSTGIGGEGCHVVEGGANANNTADNGSIDDGSTNTSDVNSKDDVVPDTISDKPLPNTGGVPLFALAVSAIFFVGGGILLLKSTLLRKT